MKTTIWIALLGAALTWAPQVEAAPYVVLPNGQQVLGTQIRAAPDGTIILTTAQGTMRYARGQYAKAVADKPAEFDQARQKAAAKDYAGAEAMLKKIIADYQSLEWDNSARAVLARDVYMAKGDGLNAVTQYEELMKSSPDAKNNAEVVWAYRDALLAAKQFDKLGASLDDTIKNGPRADAARAQIMRGDLKLAQNQVEPALLDYLRTVVLFEREKDSQPEALFKAAGLLEKLRDPRAKTLYDKLRNDYAGSPYAAKAAGK